MKRTIILLLVAIVLCGMKATAQMKPNDRYAAYGMDVYDEAPMVMAGKGWAARTIKVPGGGQKPDIVVLTKAFNRVWKVGVVDEVLQLAKNPAFTRTADPEYDSETIVDRKNGYMGVDAGGTDGEYMESCVWRRTNGHRLFAIRLGDPTDPEIELVCFYDYDPATETLTPEKSPADSFKPKSKYYSYSLPREGKDFIICEYMLSDEDPDIAHVYSFDGMKHIWSQDRRILDESE